MLFFRITGHAIRRSTATWAAEAGANLNELMEVCMRLYVCVFVCGAKCFFFVPARSCNCRVERGGLEGQSPSNGGNGGLPPFKKTENKKYVKIS